jgi:hypothetical protein
MEIASEINFLIIELKSEVYNYFRNLNLNPISDFFPIFGQVYGNVDYYKVLTFKSFWPNLPKSLMKLKQTLRRKHLIVMKIIILYQYIFRIIRKEKDLLVE